MERAGDFVMLQYYDKTHLRQKSIRKGIQRKRVTKRVNKRKEQAQLELSTLSTAK